MKNRIAIICIIILCFWPMVAASKSLPDPLGFKIGITTSQDAMRIIDENKWFKTKYAFTSKDGVEKKMYLKVAAHTIEEFFGVHLFFNEDQLLEALIITLDVRYLDLVSAELTGQYNEADLKTTNGLQSEDTLKMLWKKETVFIELLKKREGYIQVLYSAKDKYGIYTKCMRSKWEPYRIVPILEKKKWLATF